MLVATRSASPVCFVQQQMPSSPSHLNPVYHHPQGQPLHSPMVYNSSVETIVDVNPPQLQFLEMNGVFNHFLHHPYIRVEIMLIPATTSGKSVSPSLALSHTHSLSLYTYLSLFISLSLSLSPSLSISPSYIFISLSLSLYLSLSLFISLCLSSSLYISLSGALPPSTNQGLKMMTCPSSCSGAAVYMRHILLRGLVDHVTAACNIMEVRPSCLLYYYAVGRSHSWLLSHSKPCGVLSHTVLYPVNTARNKQLPRSPCPNRPRFHPSRQLNHSRQPKQKARRKASLVRREDTST